MRVGVGTGARDGRVPPLHHSCILCGPLSCTGERMHVYRYEMMAMDYCRDQNTSEIIHDFMRGFFLADEAMLKRQQASREVSRTRE